MEPRLLAAYFLIGLLVLALSLLVRYRVIQRRKHRRIMRGLGSRKLAGRR